MIGNDSFEICYNANRGRANECFKNNLTSKKHKIVRTILHQAKICV